MRCRAAANIAHSPGANLSVAAGAHNRPFAAGGPTDIVARLIGQSLSERLGQQFIVENRAGAGGNVGTNAVVHALADGYTLLMAGTYNAINATLYDNVNFARDVAPVGGVTDVPYVMEVNPSFPPKTVSEFIAYAKANPGKVNMASSGTGATPHMSGELFKLLAGVDMVHVPYRGSAPALTGLIAGEVQVYFDAMPGSIEFIRAGRFRALAVTTATRWPGLPDIPTWVISSQVMRQAGGSALLHQRAPRRKSSNG